MDVIFMEKTNGDQGASQETVERVVVMDRNNNEDKNHEVEACLILMDQMKFGYAYNSST